MRRSLAGLSIVIGLSALTAAQRLDVQLRVVDLDSGLPIPRAHIAAGSTAPLPPTFSDQAGIATVAVPPAERTVRISKPGYVPQPIRLTAADDTMDVKLARGAAIAGRVLDTLGAAVVGRTVLIAEPSQRTASPRVVRTDDLGDYRIGSLPDGTFSVSLGPATVLPPGSPAPEPSTDALPHTVVVRRGEEVGGIDFTVTPRLVCRAQDVRPLPANVNGFASIAGRVTTLGGRPLPCVEVVAFRSGDRVAAAVTDADGRYALERLRAGSYPIEFRRPGFVTLQWGQTESGQPGRPVALRDREAVKRIDASLPRGGAITGTLVDEFGEPVERAVIRALQLRDQGDRVIAIDAGSAATDDRGRYRVFGLLSGRYIVGTPAGGDARDPRTGRGQPPAYYPGTVDIASAAAVEVNEERERQWTDFAQAGSRVATITGTAVNSRNDPVTDRVILVASQRSGAVIAETHGADVNASDGAFVITSVPPGDYVLQATSKRDADQPPEFGMQYVAVADSNPLPVRIQTRAGIGLLGRLVEEGVPVVDPRLFTLEAVAVDWDQTSLLSGVKAVTADGAGLLSLPGITGPQRFVLTSSPSDWYLKSVRVRGRDVTDDVAGFPLGGLGFIRDLEIVVSNHGATIEGDVTDGTAPAAESSVVLFSTNPDHWFRGSRFLKIVRGNQIGEFRFEGIADGDYFVAAIDPLSGSVGRGWQQRDFLQGLIVGARRIRLREGDGRTMTLPITHR